jgi:DNA invertase Pin-like site-specific DNA recombinase
MTKPIKCAVILVRVSTSIQDFEPQIHDLIKYAESKGFSKIHRIQTKETGLADIKNKQGFEELVSFINENPEYNTVFATELSRIGRKQSVLHEIKDWFIKNKIQLYLKDTGYSLLNDDGSVSAAGEIMFTLFGYFAESEIKTKKERFKRSKLLLNSEGYSISGKRLFGYNREKDPIRNKNKYVINAVEADEIRKIYLLYSKGINNNPKETSISKLVNYCIGLNFSKYTKSKRNMNKLLKEQAYIGEKITDNKRKNPNYIPGNGEDQYIITRNKMIYPQIISQELFYSVQDRLRENNSNCDKTNKHVTILSKLLRCPSCKRFFTAQYRYNSDGKSQCSYRCNYTRSLKSCGNWKSISMRLIDSTIWSYIKSDISFIWNYLVDLKKDHELFELQINNLNNRKSTLIQNLDSKNRRFNALVFHDELSEKEGFEEYERSANKLKKEINKLDSEIISLNEKILIDKKEYQENLDQRIIDDIDKIEINKKRIEQVVKLFIKEIELIFQNVRFSVIKINLNDGLTTNSNSPDYKNYYSHVVIDKRDTNKVRVIKVIDFIHFDTDSFYFKDQKIELNQLFENNWNDRSLIDVFQEENQMNIFIKEFQYVKLNLFDKEQYWK